jgi:hypothetical protein
MFRESKELFDLVIKDNPKDRVAKLYLKRLYALANHIAILEENGYATGE